MGTGVTTSRVKRPRVAAIALDQSQIESIRPLCGTLRLADSPSSYLDRFSWAETDIVVARNAEWYGGTDAVPFLLVGEVVLWWSEVFANGDGFQGVVSTSRENTEREVHVRASCPDEYKTLAEDLARQLSSVEDSPLAIAVQGIPGENLDALVVTTSDFPVALRCVRTYSRAAANDKDSKGVTLLLPEEADLANWFRAFLFDIHGIDPDRVPSPPSRLGNPSDWYTPKERELGDMIEQNAAHAKELAAEQERLETELAAESENANRGVRQILWAHGDGLESAVEQILNDLGFGVQNMDSGLRPEEPKREDLRLTFDGHPGWEAIVEIKGYTAGIKTNDARQIREHREHYLSENGQLPDLTLWIVNPYSKDDPPARPTADSNVSSSAELVGAVCVQSTDLYQLWMRVAHGDLAAADAAQQLVDAAPGLWTLPPQE